VALPVLDVDRGETGQKLLPQCSDPPENSTVMLLKSSEQKNVPNNDNQIQNVMSSEVKMCNKQKITVCTLCLTRVEGSHDCCYEKQAPVGECIQDKSVNSGSECCIYCGKSVKTQHMKEHIRKHTKEPKFTCDLCGKGFMKSSLLSAHYLRHSDNKPFVCDRCQKTFFNKASLRQHMLMEHNVTPWNQNDSEKTVHKCPHCDKVFVHKSKLKFHVEKHSQNKRFICEYCSRAFLRNSDLRKHIRLHTGEMPWICNFCGRKFRQNSNLRSHLKTHNNEKYMCETCGKKYTCERSFKKHVESHKNPQPKIKRDIPPQPEASSSIHISPIPGSQKDGTTGTDFHVNHGLMVIHEALQMQERMSQLHTDMTESDPRFVDAVGLPDLLLRYDDTPVNRVLPSVQTRSIGHVGASTSDLAFHDVPPMSVSDAFHTDHSVSDVMNEIQ
jgi:hypothetical protein